MSQEARRRTGRGFPIWLRALAVVVAAVMALSLVAVDAVRVKLRADATTATTRQAVEALSESTDYVNESTSQRLSDWVNSIIRSPDSLEDYYQIASILIAQGEYARALVNIKSCLRLADGQDTAVLDELYMKKGCLEAMLGTYDDMRESFSHLSAESPYRSDALMIEAQAAVEEDDAQGAIKALEGYGALHPDETAVADLLGQLYLAVGDFERGLEALTDQIARTDGAARADAYMSRGSCYMGLARYEEALADFASALSDGYADPGMCAGESALACYLLGRYEDAIRLGEQAVSLRSDQVAYGDLYFYMGVSALSLQRFEEGKTYFAAAIKNGATLADARYYEAVCVMATGDYASAIEGFTASIAAGEQLTMSHYNRGVCYLQSASTYALAKADFEEVVKRNDDAELAASANAMLEQLVQVVG